MSAVEPPPPVPGKRSRRWLPGLLLLPVMLVAVLAYWLLATESGLRKALHDLGQVVARQPELVGQIGGRKGAIRRARHAHQHAQAVVGEGGEAHRRECPAGIGIYNTY